MKKNNCKTKPSFLDKFIVVDKQLKKNHLRITFVFLVFLSSFNVLGQCDTANCAGPSLVCNSITAVNLPIFPVEVVAANTGLSGVALGSISNAENVVSASTTDYGTINLTAGLLGSGSISIKDKVTDYPAGIYAGFEIENATLASASILGNLQITTFLNSVEQEQFLENILIVNDSLFSNQGRYKVGFVSTTPFDEVQIKINQTLALDLGSTKVYNLFFEKFCAGPDLQCNIQTSIVAPTYPVFINGANTGVDGISCVLCTVSNTGNVINQNTSDYAQINVAASLGASGSISVKDQITDYPVGSFAGFTIENHSLLNLNAIEAITIRTYLNNELQESNSGEATLVAIGTDLLLVTSKQTIGFVSTKAFDEVQITISNLPTVNIGVVNVYNAVFQKYCAATVECDKTYILTNPNFPVTIDGSNTGLDGLACLACAVNDANNVLTADSTDFAQIILTAGVVASGSIAVRDQLYTYPKGTFAGFTIEDLNAASELNLFQSLTVSTFNDGVLQESIAGDQLTNFALLGDPILESGPGFYNIGFNVTLDFDEIKLTVSSNASVINRINVYGAFIDTSDSNGGELLCYSSISITKEGTYVDNNGDGKTNIGDSIKYAFVITNTGTPDLTDVTVTDDNAIIAGGTLVILAAGESDSKTFTAVHSIVQEDIDAGIVYNLATAVGKSSLGETVIAKSTDLTPCTTCLPKPDCPTCTRTALMQTPSIAIVKTAVFDDNNGDGNAQAGETVSYDFMVINNGNVSLTKVRITDPLAGIILTGGPINLSVGESNNTTFAGSYVLTQQDIIAGSLSNQATIYGTSPSGVTVTDLSDNDNELEDDFTVIKIDGCSIKAFNAVSPNGDGLNDVFLIQGIECYPNNTVEIYNRWGIKVFGMNGYDNINKVFRGLSEGRATVSKAEGLASGTYFYMIKCEDVNGKIIDQTGYLQIIRN
ncbi:MAG: gliding motility-associated-like protein/uncharacterized repeat protein (TIGR01451 family) [Porticoccaceae bacterium]|jgi:gliding motility-associated-like protein/uncharacterized repeat protein (TIGR01451 family)